jgi:hypothetical protein
VREKGDKGVVSHGKEEKLKGRKKKHHQVSF